MKFPTIFLDRDGVINTNGFVNTVEDFKFIEGTFDAIRKLYLNHDLFVITNQGGIEAGYLTEADLAEIHKYMHDEIKMRTGAFFKRIYHCPHLPNTPCACRKPRTGMLQQAQAEYPMISFSNAYFVGDYITDWQCGVAMGIQPVAVRTGRYDEPEVQAYVERYRIPLFDDLLDFAHFLHPDTRSYC